METLYANRETFNVNVRATAAYPGLFNPVAVTLPVLPGVKGRTFYMQSACLFLFFGRNGVSNPTNIRVYAGTEAKGALLLAFSGGGNSLDWQPTAAGWQGPFTWAPAQPSIVSAPDFGLDLSIYYSDPANNSLATAITVEGVIVGFHSEVQLNTMQSTDVIVTP